MQTIDPKAVEERLARTYRELNVLYEVSHAMRTTLDLNTILHIILTGVTSHSGLGYNRALLYLVHPKTKELVCEMAISPESGEHADQIWRYITTSNQKLDDLIEANKTSKTGRESSLYKSMKNLRFPMGSDQPSLITQAFQKATPWHLTEMDLNQFQNDPFLRAFPTNELIIVPLRAKNTVNGLIIADNIYTGKAITEDDVRIFTMLANQAGLAIENSRLYEMVVQQSHTDSLTNLWNHGFFQETLSKEIETARTISKPLTLAMIDIDNFKQLNDTYGHQYGDLLLKGLAQILKDSSREMDYVCRYGGEEFALILVQTNCGQGYEVAERLRQRIENHRWETFSPNPDIRITVSIGIATFPDHAASKEELIALADKSMYIAKFSGKNRTCVAEPAE